MTTFKLKSWAQVLILLKPKDLAIRCAILNEQVQKNPIVGQLHMHSSKRVEVAETNGYLGDILQDIPDLRWARHILVPLI